MQIAILLYDGLTALDAVGPYEVLALLPGARVQFVATEAGPKRTDTGFLSLTADHSLGEVPRPDIILVPGSSVSTGDTMRDRATLDWLRSAHETTRWTTSVCSGALILAAAGLLKGKRAATHWAARPYLAQFGAEYAAERFVEEGRVITAAGVSAGIDMALHLAARVAGEEAAQVIQLITEYDPQPPFDAGSVRKATPAVVKQAERRMAELAARSKASAS